MKKYICFLIIVLFSSQAQSHTSHYKGIVKIEMDVLRNDEIIGYSNYFFEHEKNNITVTNYTKFKVKLFGADIFSILSEAIEKHKNDKLVYFKSITYQNNKEKYVNLNYDQSLKQLIIDGSSYKGKVDSNCAIGNWWNHKILKTDCQISPLSGSIKEQVVTFIGKENILINDKEYIADHFKLKSKDNSLPEDKKLNFDIWYDASTNLILKVKYKRLGNWEYRLKNYE